MADVACRELTLGQEATPVALQLRAFASALQAAPVYARSNDASPILVIRSGGPRQITHEDNFRQVS